MLARHPLRSAFTCSFLLSCLAADAAFAESQVSADKPWEIGFRAGNFLGGISGVGVEIGHQQSSALQIGALVMAGKSDLKDRIDVTTDEVELSSFNATGQVALAQARYFFGRSFYIGAGLGVRRIGFTMVIRDRDEDDRVASEAKATSAIASVNFGNLWTWDNGFYVGADWAGYMQPLASRYTSRVSSSADSNLATEALDEAVDDSARSLGTTASTQLLVLNAGYCF